MAFDIGRVCVKLAGRDAGKLCVVIDNIDGKTVLIDGATRRRKCNVAHLEPTGRTIDVGAKAAHDVIVKALGLTEKKGAKRKAAARPRAIRKAPVKQAKPAAPPVVKAAVKPAAKPVAPAARPVAAPVKQ
jgi:large subunit ribosomal protein L14e